MRINNKALAAVTATALAFGALTTPATAAENGHGATITNNQTNTGKTDTNTGKTTPNKSGKADKAEQKGSSLKDADPKEIKEWLAVLTAVLSILGTVASFGMKYAPQFQR